MAEDKSKIQSNVIILGIVSFFTDISSEMIFPILPLFLTSILGAGQQIVGLIEGTADSVASIVEIFSGYFSYKYNERKKFVLFGYSLSSLVKLGIALSTQWWHILIMRSLERVGKGIRTSPRDAIIAASSTKETRGKAFGLHRAMDTLGAILGPLIAYFIFLNFGSIASSYHMIFLIALIPAFLAVIIIFFFVKEPNTEVVSKKKIPFWQALKELPNNFKAYLNVSLLFSLSYFSFAFLIIRAADFGVKPVDILLLYVLYNIVYAVVSVPIGVLSDKVDRKLIIAASFVLYGLICVGFALANSWIVAAFLFAIYGIFVSTDESVNKAYISDVIDEDKRSLALGAYNTGVGAAYLPASIFAGLIWATFGAPLMFFLAAGIAIVAGIFLLVFV